MTGDGIDWEPILGTAQDGAPNSSNVPAMARGSSGGRAGKE
jgi:hypothetical protein